MCVCVCVCVFGAMSVRICGLNDSLFSHSQILFVPFCFSKKKKKKKKERNGYDEPGI